MGCGTGAFTYVICCMLENTNYVSVFRAFFRDSVCIDTTGESIISRKVRNPFTGKCKLFHNVKECVWVFTRYLHIVLTSIHKFTLKSLSSDFDNYTPRAPWNNKVNVCEPGMFLKWISIDYRNGLSFMPLNQNWYWWSFKKTLYWKRHVGPFQYTVHKMPFPLGSNALKVKPYKCPLSVDDTLLDPRMLTNPIILPCLR